MRVHLRTSHLVLNVVKALIIIGAFASLTTFAQKASESPFVPIYVKGDDLTYAKEKPNIIYKEVRGSRIEIPNMPAYKNQGDLGVCRAYALGAILQKHTCDKRKIADCKNPDPRFSISYFGLTAYTNVSVNMDDTFFNDSIGADGWKSSYRIVDDIHVSGVELPTVQCFDDRVIAKHFPASAAGEGPWKAFLLRLRDYYTSGPAIDESKYAEIESELKKNLGVIPSRQLVSKALTSKSYERFLYSLFFGDCEFELFPSNFLVTAYPQDTLDASENNIKDMIIIGLKEGKPVLFPNVCLERQSDGRCVEGKGHATVISGYRKVSPDDNSKVKDIFKVHNSWGPEWQASNNDGWVDADQLVKFTARVLHNGRTRISSGAVIFLR